MKYSHIILIFSAVCLIGICCSCNSAKETETIEKVEINHLVPETEYSIEMRIKGAQNLCASVQDSYSTMLELASADDASEKGIKAAKAVEEKHGERIKELSEIDFSALSENELEDYMSEMSSLITAIREARDALTF